MQMKDAFANYVAVYAPSKLSLPEVYLARREQVFFRALAYVPVALQHAASY